ncbi:hypothetical protein [Flavobacterium flavigenum]|uniref:hypothetical protein n=1 Tax=Flavobacterium flavigenum TaxID=3003258 RepID=UPI0024821E6F|nr:hypothetical protein [Flavobacterium flavigenum]
MKKIFNPTTFFIFSIFFLAFAYGLKSYKEGGNIDSTESVKRFIQGKWHDEIVSRGGLITYYRFQITETEIRCWKSNLLMSDNGRASDNITDKWNEQTPVTLSIGSVQIDSNQNKYRDLGYCNYGRFWFEKGNDGENRLYFKDNNTAEGEYHTGNLEKNWEY